MAKTTRVRSVAVAPAQPGPGHRLICVAREDCGAAPIAGAPVSLCPHHMRQTFEFASQFVEQGLMAMVNVSPGRVLRIS
jgi:hypothetical protein